MRTQQFKVGGITYTAKAVSGLYDNAGILGQTDMAKCEIEVDSTLSIERQRQTLIHEIFHAVLQEAGYDGEDEQDEELVNRASIVLYQVLKDNDFSFLRNEQEDDF